MAKPVRNVKIDTRLTEAERTEIANYIAVAEMDRSELIRVAVKEYIKNHPIKENR